MQKFLFQKIISFSKNFGIHIALDLSIFISSILIRWIIAGFKYVKFYYFCGHEEKIHNINHKSYNKDNFISANILELHKLSTTSTLLVVLSTCRDRTFLNFAKFLIPHPYSRATFRALEMIMNALTLFANDLTGITHAREMSWVAHVWKDYPRVCRPHLGCRKKAINTTISLLHLNNCIDNLSNRSKSANPLLQFLFCL